MQRITEVSAASRATAGPPGRTGRPVEIAGVEHPACGLLTLADGSLAYVVRRFDRPDGGGKLRQEDFCQYATEPAVESLKLFRQMVFCWWTGNGDMHLKNFSLLTGPDGTVRLSPAYDLLCTRVRPRGLRPRATTEGAPDTYRWHYH